ncbi:MAG: SRPBCC family protein [Pyrinomonadaceae bacterium]
MAASEKALNANESNERLWRESYGEQVREESAQSIFGNRSNANVSDTERLVSGVGGGALAAYGLSRGDWLGVGLIGVGALLLQRGVTGYCDTYNALGVNTAEKENMTSVKASAGVKVEKSFTINTPPEELYGFWRKFENLPKFMNHLESVTEIDQTRSHWKAKAPFGYSVEWDAEILSDIPNEMISWRSVENADVSNAGSVHFRPATGGRGTVVKVSLSYEPPAGKIGAAIAWLTGEEPSAQVLDDLRRFKQLMETGETATTKNQSAGRAKSTTKFDKE